METKKRYDSINGIRTIAAIGIILVHVCINTNYEIDGYVYNNVLPSFVHLVYLFMMISGFGMCCGYYDKIKNKQITPAEFYSKRYKKIWPFFCILVVADLIISHNLETIYEGFADLTLCFGLLPNSKLEVIGVGWTLGVIFLFYIIFPFFVFLLDNKKRGWKTLIISLIMNVLCVIYFCTDKFVIQGYWKKSNLIYCFIYFVIGGMIYLYRDKIEKIVLKYRWIVLALCLITTILFFVLPKNDILFTIEMCVIFALYLMYAIGISSKILNNKVTKFISSISFEIYLSHMLIFRIIEKMHLINLFGNNFFSYLFVTILTIVGSVIFAFVSKKVLELIQGKLIENKKEHYNNN